MNDNDDYSPFEQLQKLIKELNDSLSPIYNDSLKGTMSAINTINQAALRNNQLIVSQAFPNLTDYLKESIQPTANLLQEMTAISNAINENIRWTIPNYSELFKEIKLLSIKQPLESINITLQSIDTINNSFISNKNTIYNQSQFDPSDYPDKPIKDEIKPYNSQSFGKELKKRMYNLPHNMIAPFSDKTEMSKWIVYFALEQVMTSKDVPIQAKTVIIIIIAFYLSSDKSK